MAVSASSDLVPNAKEIVSFCKKNNIKTVVGGPYATINPDDVKKTINPDYLVVGDAEEIIADVLEKKPGVYKSNSFSDINLLPFPDYSLLPTRNKYFQFGTATTIGTLGCPFNCSFCQPVLKKMFGSKVRFRSPQNIYEEIKYLKTNYGIRDIYFVDDTFGLNRKNLREFVELVSKEKNIRFIVNTRADILDDEMGRLLKKMNCHMVSIGVESGSQVILDNLKKGITVNDILSAFFVCKKYKLHTLANFMIGNPGETTETLAQTNNLIKKIKPTFLYLSMLTPYPGTDIFNESKEKGLLNLMSYKDYNCRSYKKKELPLKNPVLSYDQVELFRKRVFLRRKLFVFVSILSMLFDDFFFFENKLLFFKILMKRAWVFGRTRKFFG